MKLSKDGKYCIQFIKGDDGFCTSYTGSRKNITACASCCKRVAITPAVHPIDKLNEGSDTIK